MNKKYLCIFILIIFLPTVLSQSISTNELITSNTNSEIIYVDDDNINGPWNGTINHPYKTINDGRP